MKTLRRLGCTFMAGLCLTGCVSDASIRSNKAVQFQSQVKRLFVFANLGATLDGRASNQAAVFASAFIGSLDKCGTQTKAFVQNPGLSLSLNDSSKDDIAKTIQQLEPDSILDISWRTQWSNTRGLSKTVYALQLRNVRSKAIVWKAEVDLTQGWYKAEALAGTIIGRMKQDTLIDPACVAPEPESPLLHLDKV